MERFNITSQRRKPADDPRPAIIPKDRLYWGIGIFCFALALRLFHLVQILPASFFPFKMGDAASYDAWAQEIAAGQWLGTEVFYQAPLYPYFLAVVYRLVGDDMFSIRLAQAACGSVSCVLLAGAGWRVFCKPVGIAAGLLLAAYAPALFFDSLVQKSVLDSLFLCLLLYVYGLLLERQVSWRWRALGASLGALILTRENALVFLPAILIWIAVLKGQTWSAKAKSSSWFLVGAACILLPVALRNFAVGSEFHLTTSQFGPNFYIGNSPDANGTYRPLIPRRGSAKHERRDAQELAEVALGRELTPAEVSEYWTGQAWTYIRSEPSSWFKLMGRKFVYTFNRMELVDTEDQYTYAEWSWLLLVGGFLLHMGVLMPVATWGMWCTWSERRRLLLLYLLLLFYAASVVAFYVVGRYRYPLVPVLILFAAVGLYSTKSFVKQSPRWKVAASLAGCVAVAIFCNITIESRDRMRAITHYNVGVEFDRANLIEAAIQEYELTLQLDPNHTAVHNNLGADYMLVGQFPKAIEHLEVVVSRDPNFFEGFHNLATVHLAIENHAEAASCFQRFIQLQPDMASGHLGMGICLTRLGSYEDARSALLRASTLEPENERIQEALDTLEEIEKRAAPAKDPSG